MTNRLMPYYRRENIATAQDVEDMLASAYPAIRDRADSLTRQIYEGAKIKHGKRSLITMYSAREVVLMLILKTGGDILL